MVLTKLSEKAHYIKGPANIGVIKSNSKCILIDTGIDEESGKKILKDLEKSGLLVEAIINTHSHADHCGGNSYIKKKTNASIYAPPIEAEIIRNPAMEPFYFFSGASPPKDLLTKFIMAEPSVVDFIITGEELTIGDTKISIIPLQGHSPNQIGVACDGVLFCADAVFPKEIIEKYKIPFFTDIDKTRGTFKTLKESSYDYYVPSHAEATSDIAELVDINSRAVDRIEGSILELLGSGKTADQVLKELCDSYSIEMKTTQQYYLNRTAVMAYLSSLLNNGKLKSYPKENLLLWEKI